MFHFFRGLCRVGLLLGVLVSSARAQSSVSVHLTLGNPSGALASTSAPNNYLLVKSQYALAYSRDDGGPLWVAWHLGPEWLGTAPRSDTFRADTSLPSNWHRVTSASYTGSGFDRGHLCPSADRTKTTADNQATFVMTNIIPQAPDNNQGPWARFEDYCRSLVAQGYELYIIGGGDGTKGAIDAGRVNIPDWTWKIVVVLPQGSGDLGRVTPATRVIVIDLPNDQGIRSVDWRTYRSSVDTIEYYTGFDFLSLVPASVQSVIEARVDNQ